MKKKVAAILLVFAFCLSIAACQANETDAPTASTSPNSASGEAGSETVIVPSEESTVPIEDTTAPQQPEKKEPLALYNQAVEKLQSFTVTASRELTGGNITLIGDISKLDIQPVYDFFRKVDEPIDNPDIRLPALSAADFASVDLKEDAANYTVTFQLKDCTLDLNAVPPSNGYLYFLTLQMIEDGTNEGIQELMGGSITVNILKDGGNFILSGGVYTTVINKADNSLVSADLTFKQEAVGKIKTSAFDFVKLSVDLFADISVKVRV